MGIKRILRESVVSIVLISVFWVSYAALSSIKAVDNETLTSGKWNALVDAAVPAWAVMAFNLSSCPTGWSAADGTNGNPDLRGEFIRGLDGGRGVDAGRTLVSAQWDAIRNITGTVKMSNPNQWWNGVFSTTTTAGTDTNTWHGWNSNSVTFDASTVVPTANENRPRNVALLYCIKD